jgi:hypothetical protein
MATVYVPIRRLPGTRHDHRFFPAMAVLLTTAMGVGFAPTYFLAGVFQAKLPGVLIHIHGVVFTAWFVLLLVQSALASSGRLSVHRKLGIAGITIAAAMLPLGLLATAEYTHRLASHYHILMASIMPCAELLTFATLVTAAFLLRKRPDWHKRLIILATIAIIGAAVGRMEFLPYWTFHGNAALRLAWAYTYPFLVLLIAYDLWSLRRLHLATLWGSVFIIGIHQLSLLVDLTAPWLAFAAWLQSWNL